MWLVEALQLLVEYQVNQEVGKKNQISIRERKSEQRTENNYSAKAFFHIFFKSASSFLIA